MRTLRSMYRWLADAVSQRWQKKKEQYIDAYDMVGNSIELLLAQREVKKSNDASAVKGEQGCKNLQHISTPSVDIGSPTMAEAHTNKDEKHEA